jgi:hypothetical protein
VEHRGSPLQARPGQGDDDADDARLLPGEQARIDDAVVAVGRGRGPGPVLVAALVVVAFLLGLVRPWDWLGGGPAPGTSGASGDAGNRDGSGVTTAAGGTRQDPGGSGPIPGVVPVQAPTCGYPTSWRTAAISYWAGRRARIWTAAEAVSASGPADPSIPFEPLASDTVEAMGWCAPVGGPERPPLAAAGTLFRIQDGVATEVPVDRLEPAARDALGELWIPKAPAAGGRSPWTPGRYVVRLATPSGGYARYLGMVVGVATLGAGPSGSPEPPHTAAPGASP